MNDARLLIGVVVAFGIVIILLLLRGGPEGAGGSAISFTGLREWFAGKKTVLVVLAALLNRWAQRRGWIDAEFASGLEEILYGTGAITLLAKFNRMEKKQETSTERIEVRQKVAAVKTEEVKQVIEQAVASPVTPKRVEAPPPQPAPVPKDNFS